MIRISREAIGRFAPGDFLVIAVFVLIGELSHGVLPWRVPVMVLETAMTFFVGWVVVAPLAWAYQEATLESKHSAAVTAVIAWIGATVIANGIRATSLVHGNASVTFFLVTVGFGGAMFAGWRWLRT